MRHSLIAAALLLASPAFAQQVDKGPPPGVHVESIALSPGETRAFTLAQGGSHQLLRDTDPAKPAPKAISVTYKVEGGWSFVSVTSWTGYPTTAAVLADHGDGGFSQVGSIASPGDGSTVVQRWQGALGKITIGKFDGGPEGGAPKS
ncbi:hypothetical protein [Sphingomonas immobilis]|uniref:Uncharacterized protein n=1 Tax=Sphingomonas immobilis TaxID=3063997 RepID=A0ABT8ZWP4_9SPHN|nr:hypothetical protein [Sphingomonas sp. CA1-15]MDO7841637.1 hypothetical protein [Sphingomonas sp. CA1-15]